MNRKESSAVDPRKPTSVELESGCKIFIENCVVVYKMATIFQSPDVLSFVVPSTWWVVTVHM